MVARRRGFHAKSCDGNAVQNTSKMSQRTGGHLLRRLPCSKHESIQTQTRERRTSGLTKKSIPLSCAADITNRTRPRYVGHAQYNIAFKLTCMCASQAGRGEAPPITAPLSFQLHTALSAKAAPRVQVTAPIAEGIVRKATHASWSS